MKKFSLSVFAAALSLLANAKSDMYLEMEPQSDLSKVKVNLFVRNDQVNFIEGFDANIKLPSPLTYNNFVEDPEDEEYFVKNTPAIGESQILNRVIDKSNGNLYVSLITTARDKKKGHLVGGPEGVNVGYFLFDASSLINGNYEIRIATELGKYRSFINITELEGDGYGSTYFEDAQIEYSLTFQVEDGTIKAVAAPTIAKVSIYKADGSHEDDVDYDYSTPYVPTENSLLITEDANVTGKNVILKAGETYTCEELEINDAYGFYSPVDFTADKVSYDRELDADRDYVSLCLPFAVPVGKINGAKVGYLYAFDGNDLTFRTQEGSTTPYKPYLVKTVAAGKLLQEINDPVIVKKTEGAETEVEADNATHFGQMTKEVFVKNAENDYYAFVNNRFSRVATLTVSQFRTAIKLPATTDPINKLKSTDMSSLGIKFIDGDVPTGAEVVEAEAGKVNVFDALGRAVRLNVEADKATEGLKDGIYIVNGQKVIVKNK